MKTLWNISRFILFLVVGLMNTVFIRPEDIGSWKNYVGYLFLIFAVVDAVIVSRKYLSGNKRTNL